MNQKNGLSGQNRWIIGCGLAAVGAGLFWLAVGAGALLINCGSNSAVEQDDRSPGGAFIRASDIG